MKTIYIPREKLSVTNLLRRSIWLFTDAFK